MNLVSMHRTKVLPLEKKRPRRKEDLLRFRDHIVLRSPMENSVEFPKSGTAAIPSQP